jgi:DNA/RNA-binding domain of Phe-tRNA-synthetase-like protein
MTANQAAHDQPMITISVDPHPLLDLRVFVTTLPAPLGDLPTPPNILGVWAAMLAKPEVRRKLGMPVELPGDDSAREAVRRLLRHGGFKPAGRSKPASEYLVKAVSDRTLSPINAAVDVCNIVSVHSRLPVSVVDLDKARPPFRVSIAPAGASYIFNASGQSIDLEGLLCLFDADGPCGNAVKDAQRTKTDAGTRRTLTVIWGTNELAGRAAEAEKWYRELLSQMQATTEDAIINLAGNT